MPELLISTPVQHGDTASCPSVAKAGTIAVGHCSRETLMSDDTPLLDLDELQELYDADALRNLLTQVRQHLSADLAIIRSEAETGRHEVCRSATHRLKSMLMFVTGERLRADFEHLEEALRQNAINVAPALEQLQQRLGQFDAELATALDHLA